MANRYWVGGTGSWNATTTNWSATSGGAGGASVPTLADDVFFDTLSNVTLYTVTLTTTPICRSVSVAGPATGNVTIAGSAAWSIYGSFTLAATGVTWTNTSGLTFAATTTGFTITTNGIALATGASAITLNGAGGGWTLGSALTNSGAFTFVQGSFATANFSLTTTGNFSSVSALTRSLTLGSSAISCLAWNALGATNLTVNAGTSTITVTSAAGTFNGGSLTYYNVTRAASAAATIQVGDANNTFNSISVTNASGYGTLLFVGNQTIGTLTANGNALTAPIRIISSVIGTQVTLTVTSFVTNGFINFRDINFAGAALPITVSTGGDLGNNSNITLATPKTIYWSLVAGGNWTATAWALTSGGTPATANFPLAQDTIIIEDTGLNSGATITMNLGSFIGNMSMSTRTLPMTWAIGSQAVQNYGNLTLSSAVTTTATTGTLNFLGFNKTQTITSAGVSFASSLTVNSPTLTVALAGALTTTATSTLTSGTLNINGRTLTTNLFASTGAIVRLIAFNGGTMAVLGATFTASGTNLTTSGSGKISMTSASSKTFAGGGFSYPTLNQGGAGALVITGANTFRTLANTVVPSTITLPASTTTSIAGFDLVGTAGNLVTLNSSTSGTQATINNTTGGRIGGDYLSYQDTNATPASTISAGANSTSVSNNTGWLTTAVLFATTAESFNLYLPVILNASGAFGDNIFSGLAISGSAAINSNAYDYFTAGLNASTAIVESTTLTNIDIVSYDAAGIVAESFRLYLPIVLNASGSFGDNIFAGVSISGSAAINSNAYDYFTVVLDTFPEFNDAFTSTEIQISQVDFLASMPESFTLTDSQAGIRSQFADTTESFTLADTQTTQVAFNITNVESFTLTDTRSSQTAFAPTNAESLTLTNTQSSQVAFNVSNANTTTFTDTQAGIRGQFAAVSDSTTLTNTQSAIAAFAPRVSELFILTELISAQRSVVGNISENIIFTDAQIQRGWIQINNSQTPGWTSIDDSQG